MNSLCVVLLAGLALASAQHAAHPYPAIVRLSSDVLPDGAFQYVYQTENGISAEARAAPLAASVTGQYSYTGPDNQVYTVSYVADENGYRASGAHLPQPHPIPEAIQRSIEFNLRNPEPQEFQQPQRAFTGFSGSALRSPAFGASLLG